MTNIRLPETRTCIVVWYRNDRKNEILMDTPGSLEQLKNTLIMKHKVGISEVRAIKSVIPNELAAAMTRL